MCLAALLAVSPVPIIVQASPHDLAASSRCMDARASAALWSITTSSLGFEEYLSVSRQLQFRFVPAPFPYPTLTSSFSNSRRLVTRGQICTRDGTVATSAGCMTVRSRPDQGHRLFFPPLSISFASFKRTQALFFF